MQGTAGNARQVNACSLPIIREIEKRGAAYHTKLRELAVQTQNLFVDLSQVCPGPRILNGFMMSVHARLWCASRTTLPALP